MLSLLLLLGITKYNLDITITTQDLSREFSQISNKCYRIQLSQALRSSVAHLFVHVAADLSSLIFFGVVVVESRNQRFQF